MNTIQTRSKLKEYIDKLSPEKLTIVADFVQNLDSQETMDATEELINIPNFKSAFEKANQEIKEGEVKHWRDIRNDI
ncbi:hypothetical protein ACN4EE_15830 [Geminocystis sp. CENA526]|uniref:hypothetical protein n=1 Tax=Geminocystis sp. CENA526 TaxID=1355871 RepID=UPI003D6FB660